MSGHHFITKCSCGVVLTQCRCIGEKHVTVIDNGCYKCKQKLEKKIEPTHADGAD